MRGTAPAAILQRREPGLRGGGKSIEPPFGIVQAGIERSIVARNIKLNGTAFDLAYSENIMMPPRTPDAALYASYQAYRTGHGNSHLLQQLLHIFAIAGIFIPLGPVIQATFRFVL